MIEVNEVLKQFVFSYAWANTAGAPGEYAWEYHAPAWTEKTYHQDLGRFGAEIDSVAFYRCPICGAVTCQELEHLLKDHDDDVRVYRYENVVDVYLPGERSGMDGVPHRGFTGHRLYSDPVALEYMP